MADSKQTLRNVLWAMLAFFAWLWLSGLIWPARPPAPTTQPGTSASAPASSPAETPPAAASGSSAGALRARGGEPGPPLTLGSTTAFKLSPFPMQLTVQRRGAAIADVWLSDHFESVKRTAPYHLLEPVAPKQSAPVASLATATLYLAPGGDVDLSEVDWRVISADESRAVLGVDVADAAGQPLARVLKTFELPRRTPGDVRHDLRVELTVENLTAAPLEAILAQRGPVGIRREDPRTDERAFYVAKQSEGAIRVERVAFDSRSADKVLGGDDPAKLVWAALSDKYFTAIVAPVGGDDALAPESIRETRLVKLSGDTAIHQDLTFKTVSRPLAVAAGQSQTLRFDCYLGPKDRTAFTKQVPSYAARNYYGQVTASYQLGCCAFLTFSWLTELMVSLLDGLYAVWRNYGAAIMTLVVFVRVLLHPITKKAQVNMARMQKKMALLGPKLEEVKQRCGNDRVRVQQETMKVYREAGVNPAGQMLSMLPMFLQMPIWIALYTSLNINIAMRHHGFVLWIRDLTAPDALLSFGQEIHIPLLSSMMGPVSSLNLLPILLSAAFVVQQKLAPKPPKPEGEPTPAQLQQEQMQKMMPFMSVFFGLLLYNTPSGLTLYIMTSTVIGTVESWVVRKHIKRDEALGKFDAKPPPKPKGPPGKLGLIERLQKAAEVSQQVRSRRERP